MSPSDADRGYRRGTNEGSKLADNALLWHSGSLENNEAFGGSGFSALPGGFRDYTYTDAPSGIEFKGMGRYAFFWSATGHDSYTAWHRYLYCDYSEVARSCGSKEKGFSVRLLRD